MRGTWFQLRSLAQTTFFIQNALLTPVCFALMKIVAYVALGENVALFAHDMWIDAAIAGLWSSTVTATGIIGYQRYMGTLQYLAASVVSPSAVFFPIVASAALLGVLGIPAALATVAIFAFTSLSISVFNIIGYALAMLACVASAAFLAGFFVFFSKATAYEPLILIPVWMLCGIVTPISNLPLPIQVVAFIHPLTSAVWVAHATTVNTGMIGMVFLSLGLSCVLLCVASYMLKRALHMAIKEGSLDIL
ncbi:ABC transporter [Alloscardovia theropitheci]|uniref:ABC transporter n=1 Tax=Alloscardovia theropitheci TaxID=2496842 RepID=A0A4R0QNZ6_9BIFI|nr:ABC transporter [Alloscardovia theropitheci]